MIRLYRLVLSGLLVAAGSQAATAAGLLEVYRQAADSDPQLKAAQADLLAVREAKPQARALYLPNVSTDAEQDYNFNLHSPGPNDPNFQDNSIALNLRQPIYNRGALVQIRQAESVVERAEADYLFAEQDLILRVAQAYFNVLSAADTLEFREAENDAISRQLDQAQRRFEVGLITITDVHEAQARFDLSESDVIAAQNDLADAQEALREITGQYYEDLAGLTDRMPLRLPDPSNPDVWAEQALTANPQLISAAFGVDVARENIELQRSGHYPTLDVVAGYFSNDTGSDFGGGSNGGSIGLRFNLPLYQGGAVVSRTREAAYQHEGAKQRLEDLQRAVVRQARDAYRGVESAISQVRALDQARVSTRSALEATQAGFDVGTRTIVDVLDAERNLFQSQRDYSVARYAYILNWLIMRQAAGVVSVTDVQEIDNWLAEPEKPGKATRAAGKR